MATMFSKPKMPDTSRQEAVIAKQEASTEAQDKLSKQRDAAALNARKGRSAARTSLITGGSETGVTRNTLG